MSDHGTPGEETVAADERTVTLRIFMSYRRDDASGHAGRLFDELTELGRYEVFMDIEKIDAGLAFKDAIDSALASCDVFLALIGRRWLDATDSGGRVRLENPRDLVRMEIERALDREGVRVVPVLLQAVEMPAPEALPEPLQRLAERNAHELSDRRWHFDVEQLVKALDAIAAKKAELENARRQEDERTRREREAAGAAEREAFQEQENARRQEEERRRRDREAAEAAARRGAEGEAAERAERDRGGGGLSRRVKLLLGLAAAAVVALAVGGAATFLSGGDGQDTQDTPPQAASANRAYVRTIDAMLIDSAQTRSDLGSLIDRVNNLDIRAAQAAAEIDTITDQRRSLLTAVSEVSVPPAFSRSATLLRRSLVVSIEFDKAIDSWIDAKFAENQTEADHYWSRSEALNTKAGVAKDAFRDEYNAKRRALLDKPPLNVLY